MGQRQDANTRLSRFIESEARSLGFDVIGVAAPSLPQTTEDGLRTYLAKGHHALMDWMAETADRRADPRILWPEVRSVIILAMNYGPAHDPRDVLTMRERAAISVYAQNRDYHDVMKGRLKQIAGKIAARTGADVKVFVDTAPVMEKPLAQAAGAGWQGKHTNLVSREFGSWLFLGSIFTTLDLAPDEAETDHCGSCRACLDACPTNAFPAPYRIDAGRCISYLTIEHKGTVPPEFREAMGNRIYGCDDCLAACPWNKYAQAAAEAKLVAREELKAPHIALLLGLDDAAFRTMFSGSPVKRIGRDRFVRNVLIAAGNSGEDGLKAPVAALLGDHSPLVRAMAVWASAKLAGKPGLREAAGPAVENDEDETVRAEWARAMAGEE